MVFGGVDWMTAAEPARKIRGRRLGLGRMYRQAISIAQQLGDPLPIRAT
jgi:hypothetical protein